MPKGSSNRNNQKNNQKSNQNNGPKTEKIIIDEQKLAQAIVDAYQIIEEKKKLQEEIREKHENKRKKEKWYMNVLFVLNVLFFPWKISKRFSINNQIYDGILFCLYV